MARRNGFPFFGQMHGRRGMVLVTFILVIGFGAYYYVDRYVYLGPTAAEANASRLENAVRQSPGNAQLRLRLAEAYANGERYSDAVRQYEAALKIEEGNPAAFLGMGNVYFLQNKFPEARDAYKKVADFYEDKPYRNTVQPLNSMFYNLATINEKEDKLDEAIANLEVAIAINRVDADALHRLGKIKLGQGHFDEAIKACLDVVHYVPDFPDAYEVLADAYGQLGDQNHQLYAQGMVRYSFKDYPAAITMLEKAAAALGDDTDAWTGFGMALEKSGERERAIAAYQNAERVNPDGLLAKWGIQRLSKN